MKLYEVRITHSTIVIAESEEDAMDVFIDNSGEIAEEVIMSGSVEVAKSIPTVAQLPRGWDQGAFPWGDDGTKTVGFYLKNLCD